MTNRRRPRRTRRWVAGAVAACLAAGGLSLLVTSGEAQAGETYRVPASGSFALSGRGFGHGHGMSQFGAEGMGRMGKSYRQILAFYYPGTTRSSVSTHRRIKVGITAADHSFSHGRSLIVVRPSPGLVATNADGSITLPSQVRGAKVSAYRFTERNNVVDLIAKSSGGTHRVAHDLSMPAAFRTAASPAKSRVTIVEDSGGTRTYRGFIEAKRYSGRLVGVNEVRLEDYLRSVVSAEMPGGWTAAAYQAQAVAARSYALLSQQYAKSAGADWDICDSTMCQVYGGVPDESPPESKAVRATAGVYLSYGGAPAFTQFASADGGWSSAGGKPYLVAKRDPYDGVVTGSANWGHAWKTHVTASTLQRIWPQVGTLRELRVLGRDGNGVWGGRVLSVALSGTSGTVTVSGDTFRSALGLKSTWWTVTNSGTHGGTGASSDAAPNAVTATAKDRALHVTWLPPHTTTSVKGYSLHVMPSGRTWHVGPSARSRTLRHLRNGRRYTVSVAAVYASGPGRATKSAAVAPTSTASYFRPVTPVRLANAGVRAATLGTPDALTVDVLGHDGVPQTGVRAVVLKLSTAGAARASRGRLIAWPDGRYVDRSAPVGTGRGVRSTGLVTVPAGSDGAVRIGSSAAIDHLHVDLVGYYTRSGVSSALFHPLAGQRVLDTRIGLGVHERPLVPRRPAVVQVAGRTGVPSHGAHAVLVNIGVVDATSSTTVTLSPSKAAPSLLAPAVLADAGTTRAVTAVVPLGKDGTLRLASTAGSADVYVDVLGWYGRNDGAAAGRFRATSPTRVFVAGGADPVGDGGQRLIQVTGVGRVPAGGVSAVVVTVAARSLGGSGSLTLAPTGLAGRQRGAVHYDHATLTRNQLTVPVGSDGTITLLNYGGTATVAVTVIGWYS